MVSLIIVFDLPIFFIDSIFDLRYLQSTIGGKQNL